MPDFKYLLYDIITRVIPVYGILGHGCGADVHIIAILSHLSPNEEAR